MKTQKVTPLPSLGKLINRVSSAYVTESLQMSHLYLQTKWKTLSTLMKSACLVLVKSKFSTKIYKILYSFLATNCFEQNKPGFQLFPENYLKQRHGVLFKSVGGCVWMDWLWMETYSNSWGWWRVSMVLSGRTGTFNVFVLLFIIWAFLLWTLNSREHCWINDWDKMNFGSDWSTQPIHLHPYHLRPVNCLAQTFKSLFKENHTLIL